MLAFANPGDAQLLLPPGLGVQLWVEGDAVGDSVSTHRSGEIGRLADDAPSLRAPTFGMPFTGLLRGPSPPTPRRSSGRVLPPRAGKSWRPGRWHARGGPSAL